MEKMASLEELERVWNLDDVYRANAILDMRLDLQEDQRRRTRNDNR